MRLAGIVCGLALSAVAPDAVADPTVREHLLPDGPTESCQLLVPFPFPPTDAEHGFYRSEDFEDVDRLCAMDFHAEASNIATPVGICPKIHGTTPGLELYDLAKSPLTKPQFEAARCKLPGRRSGGRGNPRRVVKLAKFKTAVFSYENESMLFYFHFSRLLGNLAHVQPATYRTVSARVYRRWAGEAMARLARSNQMFSPLDGWGIIYNLLNPRTRPRPRVVAVRKKIMASDQLVIGALVENPRGEHERHALCLRGKLGLAHPSSFRKAKFFPLVSSRRPLSQHRFSLQTLACARDYTDMIILDHVFNQIDRMGNVQQKTYYHYLDDAGRLAWKGKQAPGTVALTRLILKDNDDGLKWKIRSTISALRLIDDIRHLDPTVYRRIQWLAGLLSDPATEPAVKAWFLQSVHVAEGHYTQVRARFLDVAAKFKQRHDSGQLHLDLDLAAAMPRSTPASTRRLPSGPRSASAVPPAR